MEFLNFFVTSPWIFDIVFLVLFLLAMAAGLMRGLWRSLWHTGIVAVLLVLSYLFFAPMLANWLCDDVLNVANATIKIPLGDMEITVSSLREFFIKAGTNPMATNPLTVEFASNLAYNVMFAAANLVLTIVIYLLGWAISLILFIPFMPLISKKKKKARAEGTKYKKRPLLGALVSVVPVALVLMLMLNSGFAVNSALRSVGGVLGSLGGIGEDGGEMFAMIQDVINALTPIREGGMFLTPLAMNGNLFNFATPTFVGDPETIKLTMTQAMELFVESFSSLASIGS